jgi:hypothetical protein
VLESANVKQVDLLFGLLKQIRRREIRRAKDAKGSRSETEKDRLCGWLDL